MIKTSTAPGIASCRQDDSIGARLYGRPPCARNAPCVEHGPRACCHETHKEMPYGCAAQACMGTGISTGSHWTPGISATLPESQGIVDSREGRPRESVATISSDKDNIPSEVRSFIHKVGILGYTCRPEFAPKQQMYANHCGVRHCVRQDCWYSSHAPAFAICRHVSPAAVR